MDIIQNLIIQKLSNKLFAAMDEENIYQEEDMTDLEPSKKFGFSEEMEEKPGLSLKPPRNENGEPYLDMLKREKEEDKEFYRMILIQEKKEPLRTFISTSVQKAFDQEIQEYPLR